MNNLVKKHMHKTCKPAAHKDKRHLERSLPRKMKHKERHDED